MPWTERSEPARSITDPDRQARALAGVGGGAGRLAGPKTGPIGPSDPAGQTEALMDWPILRCAPATQHRAQDLARSISHPAGRRGR